MRINWLPWPTVVAELWSSAWTTRAAGFTGFLLDDIDTVETWVREICNDSVKPALDADILKAELENEEGQSVPLLRVDVSHSLFVHKSPGGYFRRIGSSKCEMAPDALARLFQERSQTRVVHFDESVVPATTVSDPHSSLTRRFLDGGVDDGNSDSSEASENTFRKLRIVPTTRTKTPD